MSTAALFANLSKAEQRFMLEALLAKRHGLDLTTPFVIRLIDQPDVVNIRIGMGLNLLPFAKLIECLTNHNAKLLEIINAQIYRLEANISTIVNDDGSKWLVLDNVCVDLGSDQLHEFVPPSVQPASTQAPEQDRAFAEQISELRTELRNQQRDFEKNVRNILAGGKYNNPSFAR